MQPADLLFLAALVTTLVTALLVFWRLGHRAWETARRLAVRWAAGAALYVGVLLIVSLVQPGRVIPLGQDECFDDWCIAVTAADRHDAQLVVTLRISNRGRGRLQAEPDAYVYLRDEAGHEFHHLTAAAARSQAAIGDQVPAGQFLMVQERFDVPSGASTLTLVKARRARFPGNLIIGDASSWLHQPTVHALAKVAAA